MRWLEDRAKIRAEETRAAQERAAKARADGAAKEKVERDTRRQAALAAMSSSTRNAGKRERTVTKDEKKDESTKDEGKADVKTVSKAKSAVGSAATEMRQCPFCQKR